MFVNSNQPSTILLKYMKDANVHFIVEIQDHDYKGFRLRA